jgi:PAS domain S-box-containing protein
MNPVKGPERSSTELETLRQRVQELEDTLRALRTPPAPSARPSDEPPFRSLFQGTPLSTVVFQHRAGDFVIVDYNQAAVAFTGGRMPEYVGKTARELYGARAPELLDGFTRAFQTRTAQRYSGAYRTLSTGEDRFINFTFAFVPPDYVLLLNDDVTERQRAEDEVRRLNAELEQRVDERTAELEHSKRRVDEILASIQDGFFSLDRAWRFTYINPRAARNVGRVPEQLIGQNIWDQVPPLVGTLHETYYRQVMADRVPVGFETAGVLPGPTYEIRVYPSSEGISVYWIDITERKRAEAAVRESEEQYRAFFESSMDGILITTPDGKIETANAAACAMFGYTEEELVQGGRDLVVDHSDPRLAAALQERALTGRFRGELYQKRKDGTVFPVEESTVLYTDRNGRAKTVMILRDVTERKKAEEAIRASEMSLRGVLDATRESIWVFDREGTILVGNPTALERLGKTAPEVIGGRLEQMVSPDLARTRLEHLRKVFESAQPLEFEDERDGIQFRHSFYPVLDGVGYVRSVVSYSRDITERKRAEESQRQAAQRIQDLYQGLQRQAERLQVANVTMEEALANEHAARAQAEERQRVLERTELRVQSLNQDLERRATDLEATNRELESFSYSVSHDLRTPLAGINGFASILLQDYGESLDPSARRYAELIRDNSAEMNELVEGLLTFSRLIRQPLKKQPVEVAALTRQVLEALEPQQAGRQVEVVIGDLPPCQADPLLLKQVLTNLLSNALKFTRKREVAQIEIGSTTSEDGEILYYVRDNGVGFDPEQSERLFGVFQRLHAAEDFEGTGVGLASVERIIRRHGGRVCAEGEVNQGATFYFTLG